MKKPAIVLFFVATMTLLGLAMASRITVECDSVLYYSTIKHGAETCLPDTFLITTNRTMGTVTPPSGAIGWFATDDCLGATFRAINCTPEGLSKKK